MAEPVSIKDLPEQQEYAYSNLMKEHGIISLTNVPVLTDGAAWGVLEVDSTTTRDFTEDTTDFLTAAAALIGAVLRHSARPGEESTFDGCSSRGSKAGRIASGDATSRQE
jgi:signal transduction protein with GAF and PtsI domain